MNAAVLLDSSAFIALAVPEDEHHQPAVSFLSSLEGPAYSLHSIVAEAYTHLRYRFGASPAFAFLDGISALQSSYRLSVEYVDPGVSITAEAILRQYADVKLSYVDALALAWLRTRPDVRQVFGFDEHWRIEGHLLVPR